ncbi:predicted protein [Escherichia coli B088]|nr:predicted protein [Escherichia coli B088]
MFILSLVFQWILVPGFDVDFFGYEQVYVALKMAVIGFFFGDMSMAFLLLAL